MVRPSNATPPSAAMHNDGEEEQSRQTYGWPPRARVRFWLGILMLTSAGFALEMAYTVEGHYAEPALLERGLQESCTSVLWAIGPVIGLLFQSYLGAASDRCKCSWGKRRPFVLGIAISVTISAAIFAYGVPMRGTEMATTAVAFVAMDFSMDQFGAAVRMYLLDSVSLETSDTANHMFVAMSGLGSCFGSLISAIDWDSMHIGCNTTQNLTTNSYKGSLEYQINVVYGIVLTVFVACLATVMFSVDERRQIKLNREGMCTKLDPDTLSSRECSQSNSPCLQISNCTTDNCIAIEIGTSLEINQSNGNPTKGPGTLPQKQIIGGWCCMSSIPRWLQRSKEFYDSVSQPVKLLWVMAFLDWIAYLGLHIFFSSYVGAVIYGGSPVADDSAAMSRFAVGIRIACWCTVLEDLFVFLYSVVLEWLTKLIGQKTLLLGGHLLHFSALAVLILQPSVPSAVLVSLTDGIFVANLESIPYTLILYYEVYPWLKCQVV